MANNIVATRLAVVKARLAGESYSGIKNKFGKNRLFVIRWVKRYQQSGSVEDVPRSGRPPKLSEDNLHTVRQVLKRRKGSVRRAKRKLETEGVNVHPTTVWRAAKKMRMKKVKARKKPKITQSQRQKRLDWACQASKGLASWKPVLFADEKIFELSFGVKEAWIEENESIPILPTLKYPPKIMVWGGISWYGKTKLVRVPQGLKMGSQDYIKIMQEHLLDDCRGIFNNKPWKLLEDNAPAHRAKLTQDWYKEQGIQVVSNFPPNSPDINLMENAWQLLSDMVATRRPKTLAGLWKVLQKEWENLDMITVKSLVRSFTDRLQAIIEAQGGNTKY